MSAGSIPAGGTTSEPGAGRCFRLDSTDFRPLSVDLGVVACLGRFASDCRSVPPVAGDVGSEWGQTCDQAGIAPDGPGSRCPDPCTIIGPGNHELRPRMPGSGASRSPLCRTPRERGGDSRRMVSGLRNLRQASAVARLHLPDGRFPATPTQRPAFSGSVIASGQRVTLERIGACGSGGAVHHSWGSAGG